MEMDSVEDAINETNQMICDLNEKCDVTVDFISENVDEKKEVNTTELDSWVDNFDLDSFEKEISPIIYFAKSTKKGCINAKRPPRQTKVNYVGFDLYACRSVRLLPHVPTLVCSGYRCLFPETFYGEIVGKGGMNDLIRYCITDGPAIINSDYRGVLKAKLTNTGNNTITIEEHECFAQLILHKKYDVKRECIGDDEMTKMMITRFGN